MVDGGRGMATLLIFLFMSTNADSFCIGARHTLTAGSPSLGFKPALPVGTPHGSLRRSTTPLNMSGAGRPELGCQRDPKRWPLSMSTSEMEGLQQESGLIGEDSAVFSIEEQSLKSWGYFVAVLSTVLTALYFLWINPETGFGDDFVRVLENASGGDSTITITLILGIFAVAHSGLASLRPKA
ncbi:unnamed protein product [Choristocarpus tenellus]